MLDRIRETFFTLDGRLNRLAYLKRSLLLLVVNLFFYGGIGTESASTLGNVALGIWNFIYWCASITLMTRRLHDLNKSGWYQLLFLVPTFIFIAAAVTLVLGIGLQNVGISVVGIALIVIAGLFGLVFQLWVLLKKGSEGPNDYGPDPLAPTEYAAERPEEVQETNDQRRISSHDKQ